MMLLPSLDQTLERFLPLIGPREQTLHASLKTRFLMEPCLQPVEPIEAVVKESGGCESQEQEVRSSDPSKKDSDGCDEVAGVDVSEKSPVGQVDGQPLVSPMSLGDSLIGVEKTKANGGSTVLNRTKKRPSKSNVGVAWGKLLSQCSQKLKEQAERFQVLKETMRFTEKENSVMMEQIRDEQFNRIAEMVS